MPITQTGHPGQDHSRDPCPWVILNDFGGAFAMGCIGGTIWHGIKGARNSPRGERLPGSLAAIKARAPVLGGNFGVWGGLFTTFDCTIKSVRQKEDPWNAIVAGFFTGSSLAIRGAYACARYTVTYTMQVVPRRLQVPVLCVVFFWVSLRVSVCLCSALWRRTTSLWRLSSPKPRRPPATTTLRASPNESHVMHSCVQFIMAPVIHISAMQDDRNVCAIPRPEHSSSNGRRPPGSLALTCW